MDKKELDIILKEGEGYKIEFKVGISNLGKELVAFANSSNENYFYVTFKQSTEYLKIIGREETKIEMAGLNERQRDVIDYLRETEKITTKEYVRITKTTRRTAIRDLNDMVEKKILRIMGGVKLEDSVIMLS